MLKFLFLPDRYADAGRMDSPPRFRVLACRYLEGFEDFRLADGQKTSKSSEKSGKVSQSDPVSGDQAQGLRSEVASDQWSSPGNLWQVPAILISGALIVGGLRMMTDTAPKNDFEGALAEVETLIASNRFEEASTRMREGIQPHLAEATPEQQGRFHADVADWMAAALKAGEIENDAETIAKIEEHYATALERGFSLSPQRMERWANALLDLDRPELAREKLHSIEALALGSGSEVEIEMIRNRLLRRFIAYALNQGGADLADMISMLDDYRSDERLGMADRIWAMARAAELRLEDDLAREALDHLIVDMRHLEEGVAAAADLAELYMLLGRGYFEIGQFENAMFHLGQATEKVGETDPVRGDILVLQGRMDIARDELGEALDQFDTVVREYPGTRSFGPGLLGRAEVRSILGDHEGSQADYQQLRDMPRGQFERGQAMRSTIAQSVMDRHDASIAMGNIDLALTYAQLAESMFSAAEVPVGVLANIAADSRQLGNNLLPPRESRRAEPIQRLEDMDPAIRHEASVHFQRAAEYFIRHARSVAGIPEQEDEWANSLWLAGDSYDWAGRPHQAIDLFREYLDSRSMEDPKRPEVSFRLAQAYHAELNFKLGATHYEQVIREHMRSPFATRSHVPLAQCYVAMDRAPEAERQLQQVLEGQYAVEPDARDYRNALIELGRIRHDEQAYARAVETLQLAIDRYPDDRRFVESVYRLAVSHRGLAGDLADELEQAQVLSPSEESELEMRRKAQLEASILRFSQVVSQVSGIDARALDANQEDMLRYALLFRADSAYDLGDYPRAIAWYDQAARRFSDHPSSVHALMQIVECHARLGQEDLMKIAHERTRRRLEQFSADAFLDSDVLLNREAWEQWLKNRPIAAVTP